MKKSATGNEWHTLQAFLLNERSQFDLTTKHPLKITKCIEATKAMEVCQRDDFLSMRIPSLVFKKNVLHPKLSRVLCAYNSD